MTTPHFKSIILTLLEEGHQEQTTLVQDIGDAEKSAIGTWERWTAKDYMAHLLFWHRTLYDHLSLLVQGQKLLAAEEDEDQLNREAFEKNRQRPWSEVYAELEHVHTALITLIEQLQEGDLLDAVRFSELAHGRELYTVFLGSFYEHDQEHLAQYYLERNNFEKAMQIRERCVRRITQQDFPDWVKGSFLYNLAGFYSQQNHLEQAASCLKEALTVAPNLPERSKSDPDLAAIRKETA